MSWGIAFHQRIRDNVTRFEVSTPECDNYTRCYNCRSHHITRTHRQAAAAIAMSMYCTLSENDSNCSSAFEGVDHLITSVQAVYAAIVILVSVPINIMFIAAFVRSRHLLDSSFALVISILVSNTITALFLSGQVFVTAVMQAWVLGYWGCQIFGFISTSATYSRWIAVGFLSLDRFCRRFLSFCLSAIRKESYCAVSDIHLAFLYFGTMCLVFAWRTWSINHTQHVATAITILNQPMELMWASTPLVDSLSWLQ